MVSQPEENRRKTGKTEQMLRPAGEHREPDAERRAAEAKEVVEVHGSDVQAGSEAGGSPRAGSTEPPD